VTMNSQRLSELFDALVDERTSPERRRDIEAELAEDATGRRLLAARDAFQAPPEALPPSDLAPRVLGGLPDLPPGARWTLADVVVSGWVDPALRAELWRDPRAVLAARGLVFPEHVEVVAVPLGNAHLPHAGRVALPLPPPGGRAVPEAEALRQLGAAYVPDLHIVDALADETLAADMSVQDMLIFAAKKEAQAVALYESLARLAGGSDHQKLFLFLAGQEREHKLRLEVEYEDQILREN